MEQCLGFWAVIDIPDRQCVEVVLLAMAHMAEISKTLPVLVGSDGTKAVVNRPEKFTAEAGRLVLPFDLAGPFISGLRTISYYMDIEAEIVSEIEAEVRYQTGFDGPAHEIEPIEPEGDVP